MNGRRILLDAAALAAAAAGLATVLVANLPADRAATITNASYDPTRELYAAIDADFTRVHEKATGRHVTVVASHGGSTRQARKVASGSQPADVVTLGLFSDVDGLRKRGLIADGWADRLPHHSQPYTSTIVFVVRRSNPRDVRDWPDLVKPGVQVVTPDPRTSGNGKLAALAAWAAVVARGGSEPDARAFLEALYAQVPVLDEGARGAATTFAVQEIGDVHLAWENEARREVAASGGRLEIVYPPLSILAEPFVAWVDRALADPQRLADAQAYLRFLFTEGAQETAARLGYRPSLAGAAEKAGVRFPAIRLVPITAIARDWDDANEKFFAENGILDTILGARGRWASR